MNKEEITLKVTEEKLKNVRIMDSFLKNKLNLPNYLKFGFEIEALIDDDILKNDIIRYTNCNFFDNENFRGVSEMISYEENEYGGIDNCIGGEIVTPILTDREESWLDIKRACEYLAQNATLNQACSIHTNIGVESLGSDYKNWYNFLKIIAACEPEIYRYLSSGEKIRACAISGGFRSGYAMPIANDIRIGLEKSKMENVSDINILLNNCKFNGEHQYKKNKSISLKGLYKTKDKIISPDEMEKSTEGRRIEFRMANGTFSPEKIQNQLYMISRIIQTARTLTHQKDKSLTELLSKPLPENYNESPDISRVLDVANILFDNKEDKLQFLFTMCRREKEKKDFISNKNELMKLLKEENMVLEYASNELKNDKEVVVEAIEHGGAQIQYASKELQEDKNLALISVRKYGRALQYLSEELKNDREVVLDAIKNNGCALEYTSEELKADKELILEAVKNRKAALKYANEQILLDKDFLVEAYRDNEIIHNCLAFEHIVDDEKFLNQLQKDEIIYKFFLQQAINGNEEIKKYIIKYMDNISCENWNSSSNESAMVQKRIVLETLQKIGAKSDHDFLCNIIEVKPEFFKYLQPSERNDKQIALLALENDADFLDYIGPELRGDRQIGLVVVNQTGYLLQRLSTELRGDKEIVLEAVKTDGVALQYASEDLKADRDIVIEAVKTYGVALQYASEDLKADRNIVLEAIKRNAYALQYASEDLKADRDIVLEAIKRNAYALQYASEHLKADRDIVLEAIKTNTCALQYASEDLKSDKQLIFEAFKHNKNSLRYANKNLTENKSCIEDEKSKEEELCK